MTIPRIHVKEVDIPNIYLPDWMSRQPNVDHLVPPVEPPPSPPEFTADEIPDAKQEEVIKQIKFMMPKQSGGVIK